MNTIKFLRWSPLTTLIFSHLQNAYGEVQMLDAAFLKTWVDAPLSRDRRDFKLRRTYRSRSTRKGFFGFGWCTDFEKKVHKRLEGSKKIWLQDCDRETEYDLHSPANPKDYFVRKNNIYLRFIDGRLAQKYNHSGQLIYLNEKPGRTVSVELIYRPSGLLKEAKTSSETRVFFEFNDRNQIVRINTDSERFEYVYQGENLIEARKDNRTLHNYTYDAFNNLVRYFSSIGESEEIIYDTEKDWVLSRSLASKCRENYSYELKIISPTRSRQTSTLRRTCPAHTEMKKFEFWIRHGMDGANQLERLIVHADGTSRTRVFTNALGLNKKSQDVP